MTQEVPPAETFLIRARNGIRIQWQRFSHWRSRRKAEAEATANEQRRNKEIQDRVHAMQHLHAALQYVDSIDFDNYLYSPDLWRPIIAATKHVRDARERFPDTTINFTNKKGETRTYTIDEISEQLLWIEAVLKSHHRYTPEGWKEGLAAIEKAINYDPYKPAYYCRKAIILTRIKQRKQAQAAIAKALEINPMHFEALQIKDRMDMDKKIGAPEIWSPGSGTYMLIAIAFVIFGIFMLYQTGLEHHSFWIIVGAIIWWIATRKQDKEIRIEAIMREEMKDGRKGPHDL